MPNHKNKNDTMVMVMVMVMVIPILLRVALTHAVRVMVEGKSFFFFSSYIMCSFSLNLLHSTPNGLTAPTPLSPPTPTATPPPLSPSYMHFRFCPSTPIAPHLDLTIPTLPPFPHLPPALLTDDHFSPFSSLPDDELLQIRDHLLSVASSYTRYHTLLTPTIQQIDAYISTHPNECTSLQLSTSLTDYDYSYKNSLKILRSSLHSSFPACTSAYNDTHMPATPTPHTTTHHAIVDATDTSDDDDDVVLSSLLPPPASFPKKGMNPIRDGDVTVDSSDILFDSVPSVGSVDHTSNDENNFGGVESVGENKHTMTLSVTAQNEYNRPQTEQKIDTTLSSHLFDSLSHSSLHFSSSILSANANTNTNTNTNANTNANANANANVNVNVNVNTGGSHIITNESNNTFSHPLPLTTSLSHSTSHTFHEFDIKKAKTEKSVAGKFRTKTEPNENWPLVTPHHTDGRPDDEKDDEMNVTLRRRNRTQKRKRSVLGSEDEVGESGRGEGDSGGGGQTPAIPSGEKKKEEKDTKVRNNREQSNRVGKASRAVTAGSFWQYISAYFDPITDEDMSKLKAHSIPPDPFVRKKAKTKQKPKKNKVKRNECDSDPGGDTSNDDPDTVKISDYGDITRNVIASLIHEKDVAVSSLDRPPRAATNATAAPDSNDPVAYDFPLHLPPTQENGQIPFSTLETRIKNELMMVGLFSEQELSSSPPIQSNEPYSNIGVAGFWDACCWGVDMSDTTPDENSIAHFPRKKRNNSVLYFSEESDEEMSDVCVFEGKGKAEKGESDSSESAEKKNGSGDAKTKTEIQIISDRIMHVQRELRNQIITNNYYKTRLRGLAEKHRILQSAFEKKKPDWDAYESAYLRQVKKTTKKRKKK
jgi:ribosomal protein S30